MGQEVKSPSPNLTKLIMLPSTAATITFFLPAFKYANRFGLGVG